MLPFVAAASAFLNNTPLVAMMVPVVRDLSRTTGLPRSKLYLPLSFASILGGASTLIGTSTNLIIAGMVAEQLALNQPGAPPMRNRDLLRSGVRRRAGGHCRAAVHRLCRVAAAPVTGGRGGEGDAFSRLYRVEMDVAADGPLVGKNLESAGFGSSAGYQLVDWRRRDGSEVDRSQAALEPGDRLTFTADTDGRRRSVVEGRPCTTVRAAISVARSDHAEPSVATIHWSRRSSRAPTRRRGAPSTRCPPRTALMWIFSSLDSRVTAGQLRGARPARRCDRATWWRWRLRQHSSLQSVGRSSSP